MRRLRTGVALVLVPLGLVLSAFPALAQPAGQTRRLEAKDWKIVAKESGPDNYYSVVDDPIRPYLHADYRPPWKSAVLGYPLSESERARAQKIKWAWRAVVLPNAGDECTPARNDSAAVVYVIWKRGLRWYSIKYAWSATGQKGRTCDRKRNPFVAQDTIVVESGGPVGVWHEVEIDLKTEFRNHFEGGDANADVPDFYGLALMSDGDDTASQSSADFSSFVVTF